MEYEIVIEAMLIDSDGQQDVSIERELKGGTQAEAEKIAHLVYDEFKAGLDDDIEIAYYGIWINNEEIVMGD